MNQLSNYNWDFEGKLVTPATDLIFADLTVCVERHIDSANPTIEQYQALVAELTSTVARTPLWNDIQESIYSFDSSLDGLIEEANESGFDSGYEAGSESGFDEGFRQGKEEMEAELEEANGNAFCWEEKYDEIVIDKDELERAVASLEEELEQLKEDRNPIDFDVQAYKQALRQDILAEISDNTTGDY